MKGRRGVGEIEEKERMEIWDCAVRGRRKKGLGMRKDILRTMVIGMYKVNRISFMSILGLAERCRTIEFH